MQKLKEIAGHPGFFITNLGAVYKLKNGIQSKIYPVKRKNGYVIDLDSHQMHSVLNIIIETFYPEWNGVDEIKFKERDGTIDPRSVSFIPTKNNINLTEYENKIFNDYRCRARADGANQRDSKKITGFDVLNTILRNKVKCHYCKCHLKINDWQLDHFYPVAHGGRNTVDNIVASCKRCNQMKNDLDGYAFIKRCKVISEINNDYEIAPDISDPLQKVNGSILRLEKKLNIQIKSFRQKEEMRKSKEDKTKRIISRIYRTEEFINNL